jgi:hypothetical protein
MSGRAGPTNNLARSAQQFLPIGPPGSKEELRWAGLGRVGLGRAGPIHWAGRPVSTPGVYRIFIIDLAKLYLSLPYHHLF